MATTNCTASEIKHGNTKTSKTSELESLLNRLDSLNDILQRQNVELRDTADVLLGSIPEAPEVKEELPAAGDGLIGRFTTYLNRLELTTRDIEYQRSRLQGGI